MPLTDQDVREILRIIDTAGTREIRVQTQGFSLHVVIGEVESTSAPAPVAARAGVAPSEPTPAPEQPLPARDDLEPIESPMLGTFYRAESPGEPAFVEVGSTVEADTIVCIIEVMKMMNSVPAGVAGTIVEICPENGQLVEYGAPLFRVEPA
jgi:acetyl-CoA carboxylase biotin carboxyl carrier protein